MRGRTAIAVIALAGAAATLTQAQAAPDKSSQARAAQEQQDARRGIENARANGIEVDPAAEEAMALAPVGSCPNDPAQAKCPRIKRVVQVHVNPDGSYRLEDPAVTMARKARTALKKLARAAAAPWCTLRGEGPYKAAGYAQADAHHDCVSNIDYHWLYAWLYKRYNGNLYQMDVKSDEGSNQVLHAYPNYNCTANVSRWWRFTRTAYTDFQGTRWTAGPIEQSANLNCG